MPLKKGQKLTDKPRSKDFHVRLTQEEFERLQECSKKAGVPKSKIVLDGIKEQCERLESSR